MSRRQTGTRVASAARQVRWVLVHACAQSRDIFHRKPLVSSPDNGAGLNRDMVLLRRRRRLRHTDRSLHARLPQQRHRILLERRNLVEKQDDSCDDCALPI
jgi:hypothetical protein